MCLSPFNHRSHRCLRHLPPQPAASSAHTRFIQPVTIRWLSYKPSASNFTLLLSNTAALPLLPSHFTKAFLHVLRSATCRRLLELDHLLCLRPTLNLVKLVLVFCNQRFLKAPFQFSCFVLRHPSLISYAYVNNDDALAFQCRWTPCLHSFWKMIRKCQCLSHWDSDEKIDTTIYVF